MMKKEVMFHVKHLRIKDVFADNLNLFEKISAYNVPWTVPPTVLDTVYFNLYSGQKTVSPLVRNMLNSDLLLNQQQVTNLAFLAYSMNYKNWVKEYAVLEVTYSPAENYNMSEIITTKNSTSTDSSSKQTDTNNLSNTTTGSNATTTNSTVSDISTNKPSGSEILTTEFSGSETDTLNKGGSELNTLTKSGEMIINTEYQGSTTEKEQGSSTTDVTESPTGDKVISVVAKNDETITDTPTGIEKTETTGSEEAENVSSQDSIWAFNAADISPTPTSLNEKNGRTSNNSNSQRSFDSRQDQRVIGGETTTTTTESYGDFNTTTTTNYNPSIEKVTDFSGRNDRNTTSFDGYEEQGRLSFENREDTNTKTFSNRQNIETKTFTDRVDTLNKDVTSEISENLTINETLKQTGTVVRDSEGSSSSDGLSETTHTRSGNIGVTTTQQMLQSEMNLWEWNFFYNVLFPSIDKLLTLSIY